MAPSFTGEDRRSHTRLILKAFGFEHFCTLRARSDGAPRTARLIDVSRGGARCRLENGTTVLSHGEAVILESGLAHRGFTLTGLAAIVRWAADDYVGLQFEQELPIGVTELQQMLSP